MSTATLKLAIIVGSTREGRRGDAVAAWFARLATQRDDFEIDVIDLAEIDLPADYPASPGPQLISFADRIGRADSFVIITPEYNHGYPASLKQAIDLSGDEWTAKPVGFVSYGGMSGGVRAVEQLRQIFPELHAVTVQNSVAIANFNEYIDESGNIEPVPACERSAILMLDQIAWWAHALRTARAVTV